MKSGVCVREDWEVVWGIRVLGSEELEVGWLLVKGVCALACGFVFSSA